LRALRNHALIDKAPPGHQQFSGERDRAFLAHARVASAKEDYKQIEARVPVMARALLEELLEAAGRSRADIQYFLPPQLAGKITGAIIDVLGVEPARCISRVADVGNTGNATPYFQLNELWQCMQAEEYAVVLTIESSKWLKTGMVLRREAAR